MKFDVTVMMHGTGLELYALFVACMLSFWVFF
jgi:hypothetical protein